MYIFKNIGDVQEGPIVNNCRQIRHTGRKLREERFFSFFGHIVEGATPNNTGKKMNGKRSPIDRLWTR